MSVETVNIVLSLIDTRVSSIQRHGIVVVIFVVRKVWHEGKVISRILILIE